MIVPKCLLHPKPHHPEAHNIPCPENLLLHALLVDIDAVRAVEVVDHECAVFEGDSGVMPTHGEVRHHQRVVDFASDGKPCGGTTNRCPASAPSSPTSAVACATTATPDGAGA